MVSELPDLPVAELVPEQLEGPQLRVLSVIDGVIAVTSYISN